MATSLAFEEKSARGGAVLGAAAGAVAGEAPAAGRPAVVRLLEDAGQALASVIEQSRGQVDAVAGDFQKLAGQADAVLEMAAALVGCAENSEAMKALSGVQALAAAAGQFIRERLEGTGRILETVTAEAATLRRLCRLTHSQKAVVRETGMLRVLTNIEVARLGETGAGFEYLARELDDFEQTVSRSIAELTEQSDAQSGVIEGTRRALAAELPRMRETFAESEAGLRQAVAATEAAGQQICATPARFRASLEEVAAQIAGVVAAVQAYDITRQQMEHVATALGTIATHAASGDTEVRLRMELRIQKAQLGNVRETARSWTAQIERCLEAIAQVAAAEIVTLSRMVLEQEQALAGQVGQIGQMEQAALGGNEKVRASMGGMEGLMELVGKHLQRSRGVRERLQLLMFNSIIEASHLGTQADGILEISRSIKGIAATWSTMTDESEAAMRAMLELVEAGRATMGIFEGSESLSAALEETERGLGVLREAARCAESRGKEIEQATRQLQSRIADIAGAGRRLDATMGQLTGVMETIEAAGQMGGTPEAEAAMADDVSAEERAEIERMFSGSYTTEMERTVMRAVLHGEPAAMQPASFAGNSVELF